MLAMEKKNSNLFLRSFDHKEISCITMTPETSWVMLT